MVIGVRQGSAKWRVDTPPLTHHFLELWAMGAWWATCRRVNADGPVPAVHCRRANAGSVAGGSVVSGIVESGSVARGSVESSIMAGGSDDK